MAKYELPALPYRYDALEPHVDKLTMEIHHTKHHNAYVTNLNKLLDENKIETASLEEMMATISKYPVGVRNNGGGHYNHSLFWKLMKQNGTGVPSGELAAAINASFGSFDEFKKLFTAAAVTKFGSGWTWLVLSSGKLVISSTSNHDNPLMDIAEVKGTPVLVIDVWEHAYYLKHQNRRNEFVENWWSLVNWDEAAALYSKG